MLRVYNGKEYDCSDEFSFKDFTGRSDVHFEGMKGGIVVYGSCFSQEIPDRHIFPDTMSGVIFIKCNLDNVFIPVGNAIIDCSQKKFKKQNDKNDWLVDINNAPIKPFTFKLFEKLKLPMPDPKDIPLILLSDDASDLFKLAAIKQTFLVVEVI